MHIPLLKTLTLLKLNGLKDGDGLDGNVIIYMTSGLITGAAISNYSYHELNPDKKELNLYFLTVLCTDERDKYFRL
jgi:hypothetical protein